MRIKIEGARAEAEARVEVRAEVRADKTDKRIIHLKDILILKV